MSLPIEVPLCWAKSDIEQRMGFRGGRFTRVNGLLSFLLAGLLAIAFYAALVPIQGTAFADMFTERGLVQYFTVMFTAWSLVILFFKSRKLSFQRRALQYPVVPVNSDFDTLRPRWNKSWDRYLPPLSHLV